MKAAKFRTEKAVGPRGFSRWVQPQMNKYLMQCCDCGLVHEMQFRIAPGRVVPGLTKGGQMMHVQFRARRAERYTAKARKERSER